MFVEGCVWKVDSVILAITLDSNQFRQSHDLTANLYGIMLPGLWNILLCLDK